MSIERVSVRNFQSLRAVDVELGKFTVIVGPSSSGKSAFLRSLKALISNAKGTSFVTTGESTAQISAIVDERVAVELSRGKDNYYAIGLTDAPDAPPTSFTKLAGAVPPEVTKALRMQPVKGTSINFAGQFDRPFLLDDSGADVARTLGELTNVTILFEAAREANRRRLAASATLKTRQEDLAALQVKVASFAALPVRMQAIASAEQSAEQFSALLGQRHALAALLNSLQVASVARAQAEASVAALPTPVDLAVDSLEEQSRRIAQLAGLLHTVTTAQAAIAETAQVDGQWAAAVEQGQAELRDYLLSLGNCPVCGAESEHMHPLEVVS